MNIRTATKCIREMGYQGVIIGVTGNALPSDINYFSTCGADNVLLKPVDIDALQSALSTLLNTEIENNEIEIAI